MIHLFQVSPLSVPSTRVVISGVPPFIPNELIEQELRRFGKFASGFKTVTLGCRDARLKHVISLRRQVFMFLDSPTQSLDVSFKIKHGGGYYTVYANSGSMKCFECGDVGHKHLACPNREQVEREERPTEQMNEVVDGQRVIASSSNHGSQGERVVETNRENDKADVLVEQSVPVDKVGGSSENVENAGEGLNVSEAMGKSVPVLQDVVVENNQDVEIVSIDKNQVESDADEIEPDESDGEGFDVLNR